MKSRTTRSMSSPSRTSTVALRVLGSSGGFCPPLSSILSSKGWTTSTSSEAKTRRSANRLESSKTLSSRSRSKRSRSSRFRSFSSTWKSNAPKVS